MNKHDPEHNVIFDRRTDTVTVSSYNPADIWPNWQEGKERWLFISPHDDDVACGAVKTLLAGMACGAEAFVGVVTNGKMGYCRPEHKYTICEIREKECRESFRMLGLKEENLFFLGFDDGSLYRQSGRRLVENDPDGPEIAGATGLHNSLTWLVRQARPTRVFLPTISDLHPDHRMSNSESVISIFHALGSIWPELGEPISEIPLIYEYAAYSNFPTPPTLRIRVGQELFDRSLNALLAYKSQEQIEITIQRIRDTGPKEFIRELEFDIFDPDKADRLF
ncbi:MAG: PIG-L family deacetylase [Planctomycetia bacterium]|nr:PIG-L family deacetylase [Planctomycetia bacterium]